MRRIGAEDGIAFWKIDSPVEQFLGEHADQNVFFKKLYVLFYRLFDNQYYRNGLKFIDKNITVFRGGVSKKERKRLQIDMVYSLHRFGCMFDEYFLYQYDTLDISGRESFITDKNRWALYDKLNTKDGISLFNDKAKTYSKYGIYFKRELIRIEDKETFFSFLKRNGRVVLKPQNSSGGRGIRIIDDQFSIDDYEKTISVNEQFVCEEMIRQSVSMSELHPESVNTLRIPTIRINGKVILFHPLLRVGVGGSTIDNATAGGIFALVDPLTGIVMTEARDEKGNRFDVHPDTRIKFKGFQIPEWFDAVSMVSDLAKMSKENHYIGWDIAHTDNGWVLVEGNPRGQLVMMQLFYKRGFKKEMEEYIQQIEASSSYNY